MLRRLRRHRDGDVAAVNTLQRDEPPYPLRRTYFLRYANLLLQRSQAGRRRCGRGFWLFGRTVVHRCLLGVYFVVLIDTKRILQKLSDCKQKLKGGIGAEGGPEKPIPLPRFYRAIRKTLNFRRLFSFLTQLTEWTSTSRLGTKWALKTRSTMNRIPH